MVTHFVRFFPDSGTRMFGQVPSSLVESGHHEAGSVPATVDGLLQLTFHFKEALYFLVFY